MNRQITKRNYFKVVGRLKPETMPAPMRERHDYLEKATEGHTTWANYNPGWPTDILIKSYFNYLSAEADLGPEFRKRQAGQGKVAEAKASPLPPAKLVRDLGEELRLIRRFTALDSKPRTRKQLLSVLAAVQRAIMKGHVRKTANPTPYHGEIKWIQERLVNALETAWDGDEDGVKTLAFDPKMVALLAGIRNGFSVHLSTSLALRFLAMEGKAPDKAKAARLAGTIMEAFGRGKVKGGDPASSFLLEAEFALRNYAQGKVGRVRIAEKTLDGLAGVVLGCACQDAKVGADSLGFLPATVAAQEEYIIPPPKGGAQLFRSDMLPDAHDDTLAFTGRWRELLGQPSRGFSAIIYGMPKSGKSTLAADLSGYLARNFGKALYASLEEGARGTITERLERLGASHPDLILANHLPADLGSYPFVIIDSVSRGGVELEVMRSLIRQWPKTTFIFIFHVTKAGTPRGTLEFQHEVDVIVEVKDGNATSIGRFGPGQTRVRFS